MNNVKYFRDIFIGREDAYGYYYPNGEITIKKEIITDDILLRHLKHEITIGSYYAFQIDGIWYCKWICIDIDDHTKQKSYEELELLSFKAKIELIDEYNIKENQIIREFSGRGFHIWILLKKLTFLDRAYDFKCDIEKLLKEKLGLNEEIFPKQAEIDADGYGNWVKLPLSINRKNGKFCEILDDFDLSKQGKKFKIPEWIQKQEKKEKENPTFIKNRKILIGQNNENKTKDLKSFIKNIKMFDCLREIMLDNSITHHHPSGNGHYMNLTITDILIYNGASDDIIHQVFSKHPTYNSSYTQRQIESIRKSLELSHVFIKCETIKKRGFCIECKDK